MRISIKRGKVELAYMYSEDQIWRDPYGGFFSEDQEANMTSFIQGEDDGIVLGASGYTMSELRVIVKP